MFDPDCLFCKIAAGQVPSKQIFADDDVVAFLDISPWQEGHSLVIPRRHCTDVLSDEEVLEELAPSVVRLGNLLMDKLGATGCNVLANAGADAGQEIFHTHIHVIPRYPHSPGIANIRGDITKDLDEVHVLITG